MSFLGFFKYVLFVYNFIVMTFGATLLALATYFYVDTLQYIGVTARLWPIYSTLFIIIIGIGLLTFIVGFFGCCGACKESSCMLCLYFTIIIAICALIGTIVFMPDKFEIKPEKLKLDLQQDIKEIMQKSYSLTNTTSFANLVIDKIQDDFQCCGSRDFSDWEDSLLTRSRRLDIGVASGLGSTNYISAPAPIPSQRHHLAPQSQPQLFGYDSQQSQPAPTRFASHRVPISCCSKLHGDASYNQCKEFLDRPGKVDRVPNINPDGCVDKIHNYLFVLNWWPLNIIGGLAIGLQGLSLIFSFCLCCAINRAIDDDYDEEDK